jgi:D-alanyl-D-alanine carboxypeptidase/D-alanyl-D-alanine-endopeptidase (penicillin-binding protein 4)
MNTSNSTKDLQKSAFTQLTALADRCSSTGLRLDPPSLPYVRRKGGGQRGLVSVITAVVAAFTLAAEGLAAAAAPAPGVLPPLPAASPAPTPDGVARALAGALADPGLGGDPHMAVVDVDSGRVLLDHHGAEPALPASTTKLITAASALLVLGPRARFTTRVLRSGPDLYLVGGGDPTLSTQAALEGYPAPADLLQLARAAAKALPTIRTVYAVGSRYGGPDAAPGWSPSYLADGEVAPVRSLLVDEAKDVPGLGPSTRVSDPVAAAAETFRAALTAAGAATGPAAVAVEAPSDARLVASAQSPPVAALVERMLDYSDADIAEGLGRQVALHSGLPATFDGAAAALTRVARRLGLPLGAIVDASGLSRSDALAPIALTTLLRRAATGTEPALRLLPAMLPVAGFSGTLAARFTGPAAAGVGRVQAKTGWLNGAAALAGLVTTRDGRLLAFAALAPASVRSAGEGALDRLAATLAACGCR